MKKENISVTLNGENKWANNSAVQLNQEKEPYYYAFVKLKGHGADLPVIFKVKKSPDLFVVVGSFNLEPQLKKGNLVQLTGHYSNSDKNIRKSFTCSAYELVAHE